MEQFSRAIQLVPNGCDPAPEIVEPKGDDLYDKVLNFQGKVIGFVGNLESKIDIELLERIAKEFPDALLVLVGSCHANASVGKLAWKSNVIMPGPVPYEEIGAWVRRFDVGIVPHLVNDLTKNMNPLKIFVYAVHGIPVVSTAVPNLPAWCKLEIASSREEFLDRVKLILAESQASPEREINITLHSWEDRLKKPVSRILTVYYKRVV